MVDLLQVVGIGYVLLMLYLTFLYYKKNNYSARSFIFWIIVWSFGVVLLVIPETTSQLTQRLNVARVMDFYLILGLMFFSVICFLNYAVVQRTERRVEDLVREIAVKNPRKKR